MHSTNNKWLTSLNSNVNINPARWCSGDQNTVLELRDSRLNFFLVNQQDPYDFPDEDFCLFQHFPHSQNILISFTNISKSNTCSYLYLTQYMICDPIISEKNLGPSNQTWASTMRTLPDCNFEKSLSMCSVGNFSIKKYVDTTIYDVVFFTEIAELVGPIITLPLISFFGFLLNLLVVLVIQYKPNEQKYFKGNRIYSFIKLNSLFNTIECLIPPFTLMNQCLGVQSIYCSSVQRNLIVQWLNILVVHYLGDVMKTCSIIMLLAFSFERYIQTTESKSIIALKFRCLKVNVLVCSALTIGVLNSATKILEYSAQSRIEVYTELETPYWNFYMLTFWWFDLIYAAHYIINDFLLLFVNLAVDFCLVAHIRCDLKKKERFSLKTTKSKIEIEKKQKEKISAENKTNKMIAYQIILFGICRLPELVYYFHFFFLSTEFSGGPVRSSYEYYCFYLSLCYLASDLIQYVYIVSYAINAYFFYKFNKPFRHGFKNYFNRKAYLGT